jgi:DNA-binding transcriptional ArsR family regulator
MITFYSVKLPAKRGYFVNIPTRERASSLFAALGHPTRLRIVELLMEGEQSVNEIAKSLNITQSGTSQHLAILTRAGILVAEPRRATRMYRIRGPRISRILDLITEFCEVHHLYGTGEEAEHLASSIESQIHSLPEQPEKTLQ